MSADFARARQELEQGLHANTIALQLLEHNEATIQELRHHNDELSKENAALNAEITMLRTVGAVPAFTVITDRITAPSRYATPRVRIRSCSRVPTRHL